MELDEYRAIKEVPRSMEDYQQFRKEALILKSLRHPSIPIVYDLEETADHFYMIEEWIDGTSLYRMISDLGRLSQAATVSFGIQICHLVHFLHSAKPNPILYLDLHPQNLIICRDIVKLIDFDHAVRIEEAEHLEKRYGMVGFAAPEQYTGDMLDEKTDIYAIGAVLYYMLTGEFPGRYPVYSRQKHGSQLLQVIKKCLREDPKQRFASAEELKNALEKIKISGIDFKQGVLHGKNALSITIAVAGSAHGVGATHIAICMAVWLRRQGIPVLYEECHSEGGILQYAEYEKIRADSAGVYRIGGISIRPWYGAAVKMEKPDYRVHICDYGVVDETFFKRPADEFLLVCGSRPWEWESGRQALKYVEQAADAAIIYNHYDAAVSCLPVSRRHTSCFLMPCVSNPWAAGIPAEKVYEAMWLQWTGQKKEGWMRRWLGKGNMHIFRQRS